MIIIKAVAQRERAKYMKERSDNEYLDFSC